MPMLIAAYALCFGWAWGWARIASGPYPPLTGDPSGNTFRVPDRQGSWSWLGSLLVVGECGLKVGLEVERERGLAGALVQRPAHQRLRDLQVGLGDDLNPAHPHGGHDLAAVGLGGDLRRVHDADHGVVALRVADQVGRDRGQAITVPLRETPGE